MSAHQRISQVIDDMINKIKRQNTSRYQKPIFLQILLDRQIKFKKTLNQTLRDNNVIMRDRWLNETRAKTRSNYYTIVGEVLMGYLNDELEKDILSLTDKERQTLIEKINQEIGRN